MPPKRDQSAPNPQSMEETVAALAESFKDFQVQLDTQKLHATQNQDSNQSIHATLQTLAAAVARLEQHYLIHLPLLPIPKFHCHN